MLVNNHSTVCAPPSRGWDTGCLAPRVICGPCWWYLLRTAFWLVVLLLRLEQLVIFLLRAWLWLYC